MYLNNNKASKNHTESNQNRMNGTLQANKIHTKQYVKYALMVPNTQFSQQTKLQSMIFMNLLLTARYLIPMQKYTLVKCQQSLNKYKNKQFIKYQLNCHLLKLLSSMEQTLLCIKSSDRTRRNSSLPAKIKIRTCKLPRDFFQKIDWQIEKSKSGCESRGSTCDQENGHPQTPSFKNIPRQLGSFAHISRKAQTVRVIPFEKVVKTASQRQKNQSIKRKLSRQIHQKFPILLLPPLIANKICLDL